MRQNTRIRQLKLLSGGFATLFLVGALVDMLLVQMWFVALGVGLLCICLGCVCTLQFKQYCSFSWSYKLFLVGVGVELCILVLSFVADILVV